MTWQSAMNISTMVSTHSVDIGSPMPMDVFCWNISPPRPWQGSKERLRLRAFSWTYACAAAQGIPCGVRWGQTWTSRFLYLVRSASHGCSSISLFSREKVALWCLPCCMQICIVVSLISVNRVNKFSWDKEIGNLEEYALPFYHPEIELIEYLHIQLLHVHTGKLARLMSLLSWDLG